MHPRAAVSEGGCLDFERLAATPLIREPFEHIIVPEFLRPGEAAAVARDFPDIRDGGSFPVDGLDAGPAFARLVQDLRTPRFADALSAKFGIDLHGRPLMLTVRGRSRLKDGRIHADSEDKLLTALLYVNESWQPEGGRLRLLRSPEDLEDYVAEVPPHQGTLLAFRCSACAWHGHKPYVGVRRSLQVNWLRDERTARRERSRHGVSALFKRLFAWRPR